MESCGYSYKRPQGEKGCKRPTANGDISSVAKLDIRIEAFHRLRVGSSPVIRFRCINSYAFRGSVDASGSGASRTSSGRSDRSPRDIRLLRPLSGLKSFWGRIWKKPPEAATAKKKRIYQGRICNARARVRPGGRFVLESLHRSMNLSSALELTRKMSGKT